MQRKSHPRKQCYVPGYTQKVSQGDSQKDSEKSIYKFKFKQATELTVNELNTLLYIVIAAGVLIFLKLSVDFGLRTLAPSLSLFVVLIGVAGLYSMAGRRGPVFIRESFVASITLTIGSVYFLIEKGRDWPAYFVGLLGVQMLFQFILLELSKPLPEIKKKEERVPQMYW